MNDAEDAARYRWLRDTMMAAKGGASIECHSEWAYYEQCEAGKAVRIQWYPNTPVGFLLTESDSFDEAVDAAMKG